MIDVMALSPKDLDKFIRIQAQLSRQNADAARIRDLRDYYYGEHPTLLTKRQQEFLGPLLTESEFPFAHNLTATIIDTIRERLGVIGFRVGGEVASNTEDAGVARLWKWWNANKLDEQQIRVHRRVLRDGWSYVMVDYDTNKRRPRITVHKRDDGVSGIMPTRSASDPNVILFVSRYFFTDDEVPGIERKTVYLPHEIQKYIRGKAGAWDRFMDPGDESWPIPWVDRFGEPLGIPVIEFQNPGGSEIAGVVPLQNALNKAWLDLIAAADESGFPILAIEYEGASGFSVTTDDDNLTGSDEFNYAPGRAIEVDNANVKRLDASSLTPMIETMWAITTAIAGVSRTPQYYLRPVGGSEFPSGEALKQLESGLVKRAEERQLVFGHAWADVMQMCTKLDSMFGVGGEEIEEGLIATLWTDPNVRNEVADAEVGQLHDLLGVPREVIWANIGYDPGQVEEFKRNAQKQRSLEISNIVATVLAGQQQQPTNQTNPNTFEEDAAASAVDTAAPTVSLNGAR